MRRQEVMIPSDQRLQPIDLLKIYGEMEYEWHLLEDRIEWQGPFHRLLSPNISLDTGSSFGNLLSVCSFNRRAQTLAEAYQNQDSYYSVAYHICLPNHEYSTVLEEGQILKKDGMPKRLLGYLNFKDLPASALPSMSNFSGYDMETGLPEREILLENLISIIEQCKYNHSIGAYIALTINQLHLQAVQMGAIASQEFFRQTTLRLRAQLRKTDIIGRISSTCLGIILPDCSQEDLATTFNKIMASLHAEPFQVKGFTPQYLNFSVATQKIAPHASETTRIMARAEESLFNTRPSRDTLMYLPTFNKTSVGLAR
jgi:diguanylate cyclase (GGDEF)-like protein